MIEPLTINDPIRAGIELSIFDKCACAVTEILKDSKLWAWAEGRISRGEVLALPISTMGNQIWVGLLPPVADEGIGSCTKIKLPILVAYVWEQYVHDLSPQEGSIYSVMGQTIQALAKKPYLDVQVYGGERLSKKLNGFRMQERPRFVSRQNSVLIQSSLVFEYELEVDAGTMASRA